MARIMYLTHTGMAEPLGQSQVLGYLKQLSKEHDIHLISFEKPADFRNADRLEAVRAQCAEHGIEWTPRRFRQSPRYLSSALNIWDLYRTALRVQKSHRAEVLHSRSYLPSLVASWVGRKRCVPFIFDMRALWPEELIGAGRVKSGGVVHRALIWVERHCLKRAGHTVSLTHAAINYLERKYPSDVDRDDMSVIPTCVDLEKFALTLPRDYGPKTIGCSGTVISGFFRIDLLARMFAAAAKRWPNSQFEIVSRDDQGHVTEIMNEYHVPTDRLSVRSAQSFEMPEVHRGHDVSLMFFTTNTGKLGSCPTRMGEALACGTPVIINPGIGDVSRIAENEKGVVTLDGETNHDIDATLDQIEQLWSEKMLAQQCRQSAENVFSLDQGVASYDQIYRKLSGN